MRPRKAANGLLIIVSLLALIAFVGCDLAGYDITEDADVLSRGKPAASTKAPKDEPIPPVIYSGAEGEVIPVDSTDQYETRWEEGDPRYRLLADTNDDGIVEAWEVVTENATHALVGEKFIGYYSSTFSLWAGQDNFAGDVTISNGLDGVTLSVDTTGSADIAEYHIYTYTSEGDLPDKRPAPGQAPYVVEGLDADSFEIFFSFEELGGTVDTTYYFIIHAALADDAEGGSETSLAGETAYVAGEDLPDFNGKGAWFYVVSYSAVPYFEPIIELLTPIEPPVVGEYFPDWLYAISNLTLIFDTAAGDTEENGRNDGYYTIHIQGFAETDSRDLDDMIGGILDYLFATDPVLADGPTFLGAVIKGGQAITKYYEYGIGDEGEDALPEGVAFVLTGTKANVDPTNAIDVELSYGLIR
jgi:hypothetical protein